MRCDGVSAGQRRRISGPHSIDPIGVGSIDPIMHGHQRNPNPIRAWCEGREGGGSPHSMSKPVQQALRRLVLRQESMAAGRQHQRHQQQRQHARRHAHLFGLWARWR